MVPYDHCDVRKPSQIRSDAVFIDKRKPNRTCPGVEPRTSHTRSENHPTRPTDQTCSSVPYFQQLYLFLREFFFRESICHFSLESVVPITHEQNIICSKTRLNSAMHEQTIICRQLFVGHVVGSRPMERKKAMRRMITFVVGLQGKKCTKNYNARAEPLSANYNSFVQ